MLADVRRRKFDVVAVNKLDRLARSTRHLVTLTAEFEARNVDLVVLDQAVDITIEFERSLIVGRVVAGIRSARKAGP